MMPLGDVQNPFKQFTDEQLKGMYQDLFKPDTGVSAEQKWFDPGAQNSPYGAVGGNPYTNMYDTVGQMFAQKAGISANSDYIRNLGKYIYDLRSANMLKKIAGGHNVYDQPDTNAQAFGEIGGASLRGENPLGAMPDYQSLLKTLAANSMAARQAGAAGSGQPGYGYERSLLDPTTQAALANYINQNYGRTGQSYYQDLLKQTYLQAGINPTAGFGGAVESVMGPGYFNPGYGNWEYTPPPTPPPTQPGALPTQPPVTEPAPPTFSPGVIPDTGGPLAPSSGVPVGTAAGLIPSNLTLRPAPTGIATPQRPPIYPPSTGPAPAPYGTSTPQLPNGGAPVEGAVRTPDGRWLGPDGTLYDEFGRILQLTGNRY